MKHSVKRILSILLAAVILVSACSLWAFAEEKTLVILGDSNSAGFGLPDYEAKAENAGKWVIDGEPISGSFASKVAEALGLKLQNLSHCGWRTTEILEMLKGTPENLPSCRDYAGGTYLYGLGFVSGGDFLNKNGESKRIRDSVKNANTILLSFGSNDIYTLAFNQTTAEAGVDLSLPLSKGVNASNFFKTLFYVPNVGIQLANVAKTFIGHVKSNAEYFKNDMKKVVSLVHEQNPSAQIVVLGIYCPISFDLTAGDKVLLDVKTFMDRTVTDVNASLRELADVTPNCVFVDSANTMCNNLTVLDFDQLSDETMPGLTRYYSLIKLAHPSLNGHSFLTKQILAAISMAQKAPKVQASYTALLKRTTLKWDAQDGAKSYRIYRSTSRDSGYSQIGVSLNTTFCDILTLRNRTYYYKVCAVRGSSLGTMSEPVAVTAK